ncbi:hypothetical protein CUJ88_03610 [Paraburkholderia hospita]|jgi:hypothetical protein|uniref:Uncharacterized protein n=1 Tax=Paraburkholderia hospita TaxID=169430 RepID=A0ABN0FTV4_9BURK|nr:hypothetical protein CUJ88_03610 [Paraburkholderia hospita]EIN02284.1 hypothetical protein WQE_04827 [Paraburkholderia hospita]OUL72653.1 hypothetical protein CA602_43005 [Paraburkholderia hospita]OUL79174.1 hypothetical protein CA601_35200 [Paraburkholderia hospita]
MKGKRGRKETAILPPIAPPPPVRFNPMRRAGSAAWQRDGQHVAKAVCPGLPESRFRQVSPVKMG